MTMTHEAGPFDFSLSMRRLCEDVVCRVPEFSHVRMDEVAVTFAQARRNVLHGLQAKLTPMRFENGELYTRQSGRTWMVQRLFCGEREMLYILTFYLPRFLNHTLREKLITVFHELYHIGPQFDGDIRRFAGRCHVHSHSQKDYDAQMGVLVDAYLKSRPPLAVYGFLKQRFRAIEKKYGAVVGARVPIPKLIPVVDSEAA